MPRFEMPEKYRKALFAGDDEDFRGSQPEGEIIIFTGRKRQGKSLCAAGICYDAHLLGWPVIHNGSLHFGEKLDMGKLARLEYRDSFVFIDEAHIWLDPRRGMGTETIEATHYLTQIGKLDNYLIVATHRLALLDLRLRDAADLVIDVKKDRHLGTKLIYWKIQDINGSFSEYNRVFNQRMHDMDDYYPVYDTKALFDRNPANKRTAATIQQERKMIEFQAVNDAVATFVFNEIKKATSGDIALWISENKEVMLSPGAVGRILTNELGITQRKSGARYYDLSKVEIEAT